jgi:hypothetical protein
MHKHQWCVAIQPALDIPNQPTATGIWYSKKEPTLALEENSTEEAQTAIDWLIVGRGKDLEGVRS